MERLGTTVQTEHLSGLNPEEVNRRFQGIVASLGELSSQTSVTVTYESSQPLPPETGNEPSSHADDFALWEAEFSGQAGVEAAQPPASQESDPVDARKEIAAAAGDIVLLTETAAVSAESGHISALEAVQYVPEQGQAEVPHFTHHGVQTKQEYSDYLGLRLNWISWQIDEYIRPLLSTEQQAQEYLSLKARAERAHQMGEVISKLDELLDIEERGRKLYEQL